MPSIWSAFSSSSSSSSRPFKGKSKSSNDIFKNINGGGGDEQKRKLTRQRKLRHVTDDELGLKSGGGVHNNGSQSCPVSPDSGSGPGSGARTPSHCGGAGGHWSKSAVPQPLPRPETGYPLPQNDTTSHGPRARNPRHQFSGKTTDDIVGKKTYKSPSYRRRRIPQHLNLDTSENDFHRYFPAMSAPSSVYSSPTLSPKRYGTVDLIRSPFQVPSDFEVSKSDRMSNYSYQLLSPLHSPLHSPTKHEISTSRKGIFVHSHNKSLPESSTNVHPLPRPPTTSRSLPTGRQSIDRSDVSPSIKGQWQRGRPIGRGTFGSVYIATHRETGATCAVKEVEMIPDDPKCNECIKQLEQEIKFLRELKHPNIVQYYGSEIIDDRFCIYLEYVHPGSVNKYVQEHCGAMTESIVRNFTRHILSGLAYLHSTKTIHRDIKGANLLVNSSGVVKLADFGLAKHLTGHDIDLSLKGTPHWMAPEVLQAAMRKDNNPELAFGVDIWSVGCTVIEMLTGKPPWSDSNGVQAMFNVLNKTPPVPETLSDEGKDFLQWCFQRRPKDRPSAVKLLQHPFLRSSQDQIFSGFVQEFSGFKLHDFESTTWIKQGKSPLVNGQCCTEQTDSGANSHNSPRSTLEAVPRVISPEVNYNSNNCPSNIQNNLVLKAVNNNLYSFSCKGNLTLLMPKMEERKKHNVQQEIN
ncbi:hypothetical protein ABFX02_03G048400 [Erythranthe guttata]